VQRGVDVLHRAPAEPSVELLPVEAADAGGVTFFSLNPPKAGVTCSRVICSYLTKLPGRTVSPTESDSQRSRCFLSIKLWASNAKLPSLPALASRGAARASVLVLPETKRRLRPSAVCPR
jgi:hypothetical protein